MPDQRTPDQWPATAVTVKDVDMPFMSMVWFMVKWAVATIPALIILFVAGAVCVTVLGAIGLGFRGLSSAMDAPSSRASLPSAGDSITLHVTSVDGNVAITNRTDYLLNLCRAERSGGRAFIPTMVAGATVTVDTRAFRPTDGAHAGSDVRVTCDVDGTDTAAVIR